MPHQLWKFYDLDIYLGETSNFIEWRELFPKATHYRYFENGRFNHFKNL